MNSVRIIRERLGLTQEQLAQAVGITQGAVSYFERGDGDPSVSTARRLIDVAREAGVRINLDDVFQQAGEAA